MSITSTTLTVTLSQAARLIAALGSTNTVLLEGQPGIGKSAILKMLAPLFPEHVVAYIDCANLDLGDLAMPVVDQVRMVTHYAPNARFGVSREQTRPVLLMLDELGKAPKPVMNMLLPVLHEGRLGDLMLPPGSIRFATTNLRTDGVGDNVPAHGYNRMIPLNVANPTSDEWLSWAVQNAIDPLVMNFAQENPQVFERYDMQGARAGKDANPYIFDPVRGNTRAFVSPRSLEAASNIVKQREVIGDAMLPALAGAIGEPAARLMEAQVRLDDQLPRLAEVLKTPTKAKLPNSPGAYFLMAFKLAAIADADNLDTLMTYVDRWTAFEASTLFITTLAMNPQKVQMAVRIKGFTDRAAKLGKYFG